MCQYEGPVGQEESCWLGGFATSEPMFEEYGTDLWCVQCLGTGSEDKPLFLFPDVDHYNLHLAVKHVAYLQTCAYTLAEISKIRQDLQTKLGM